MSKKMFMLGSIILLISSFVLVNRLQNKNFTVFNTVSEEGVQQLQSTLNEVDKFNFTALLCNEIRLPFDDPEKTFYVPLNMESEKWEKLEFISGQPEYQILFSEDVTNYEKKTVIANGKKFPITVYDGVSWSTYYVVFSGVPIIDLATNEGFWHEEITGTVVFYDTNFTQYGTEQSDYNGHIRGNTSRMFPKKGYKLNLTENVAGTTQLHKMALFGMREDDDWILHALYNDDTKIRDRLSMEIWEQFGANAVSEKSHYGPKMTYVEVFADNSYCGLYGLMEPVDDKQMDLQPEDYSYKRKNPGGLVYQRKTFAEETNPYKEVEGFEIKEGAMTETAWVPMSYLCAWLTLPDEEALAQNSDVVNVDSAMRLWMFLQMITGHDHTAKNVYYVAKYDEEKSSGYEFYFAPWDMDLTWGNVSVGEINSVYTAYEEDTYDDRVYWETGDRLVKLNYDGARDDMQTLYTELREGVLSDAAVERMILELDHQVRDSGALARDRVRWTDSVHAEDCRQLVEYAKMRLEFLDHALYDRNYLEVE